MLFLDHTQVQYCKLQGKDKTISGINYNGKAFVRVKAFPKERLLELIGVPLSMARVKCALLSLKVLKAGAYGLPDPGIMRHEDE